MGLSPASSLVFASFPPQPGTCTPYPTPLSLIILQVSFQGLEPVSHGGKRGTALTRGRIHASQPHRVTAGWQEWVTLELRGTGWGTG